MLTDKPEPYTLLRVYLDSDNLWWITDYITLRGEKTTLWIGSHNNPKLTRYYEAYSYDIDELIAQARAKPTPGMARHLANRLEATYVLAKT